MANSMFNEDPDPLSLIPIYFVSKRSQIKKDIKIQKDKKSEE